MHNLSGELKPPSDAGLEPSPALLSLRSDFSRNENPPWTFWAVLQIIAITLVSVFAGMLALTFVAHRLLYPAMTLKDIAELPLLSVVAQTLAYVAALGLMVSIATRNPNDSFLRAVRWNWPRNWPAYMAGGLLLSLLLQGLAHFLPMPKNLPIDRFFDTATEAWVISIFGVTVAPFMEELFFRGFLYPVLARRTGAAISIVLTSAAFGLVHAQQLGRAWGPILIVCLVGLTLTITRAVTKSVAPGVLIHAAYNATISVLVFIQSQGFHHLEKLNQ